MFTFKYLSKLSCLPTKLLTLCLSLFTYCQSHATTYDELAKIDNVCLSSASQCLLLLDDALVTSPAKSRQWYRLKLLQLDAFFTLQQLKNLSTEIDTLLIDTSLPINFSVYVYIYYAKLNHAKDNIEPAKKYLDKAVLLLKELNNKYPKPMRLIEIANLQTAMKDYDQAKLTLLQLELKFKGKYHPIFKRELYANLGHVANFQQDIALHVKYRKKSLKWALRANNIQQVGIAYYNLARAYQKAEYYEHAEDYYLQAINSAQLTQDDISSDLSQLRLIEVVILQGEIEQALILFNKLPESAVSHGALKHHNVLYQQLKTSLKL
jgi:tetratricopeptide (TPR) repeat protein